MQWTPGQTMTIHYYKSEYDTKTWTAGKTYKGVPYNHGGSSLEQFESYLTEGTLSTALPNVSYYVATDATNALNSGSYSYAGGTISTDIYNKDYGFTVGETVETQDQAGFSRYFGNDCSSAIMWAWRHITSSWPKTGGTVIDGVSEMVPTTAQQTKYGVLPVNNMVPTGSGSTNWEAYYASFGNGAQKTFMEAYAQASAGDAIIAFNPSGGHSRMIAYDPVTIRNYKGEIQKDISYLITHEQGRTSKGGTAYRTDWESTCSVNWLYTYDQLTAYEGKTAGTQGIGSTGRYLPMTIPVFHEVNSKAITVNLETNGSEVKSNFYILKVAMDGKEVYSGYGQHRNENSTCIGTGYRDAWVKVDVAKQFGLKSVSGETVTVTFPNGTSRTVTMP